MEVLYLTMFVSLVLGGLGAFLFAWSAKSGDYEHADRLAILPLRDGGSVQGEFVSPAHPSTVLSESHSGSPDQGKARQMSRKTSEV